MNDIIEMDNNFFLLISFYEVLILFQPAAGAASVSLIL